MSKVFVSKKQIISIEEFMENYIGKQYDGDNKLTHREMMLYLYEKGLKVPRKVSFDIVRKETILNGTYIVVKDNASQVLIYENPRLKSLDSLLEELRSKANLVKTAKIRRKILKEIDAVDNEFNNDEYDDENYFVEKHNRNKQFVIRNKNLYRKINY